MPWSALLVPTVPQALTLQEGSAKVRVQLGAYQATAFKQNCQSDDVQ